MCAFERIREEEKLKYSGQMANGLCKMEEESWRTDMVRQLPIKLLNKFLLNIDDLFINKYWYNKKRILYADNHIGRDFMNYLNALTTIHV